MAGWVDIKGPIVADTVYSENQLVARDAAIKLPAVSFGSADFKAMGTVSLPLFGQIDSMEASVTKVGIDLGLGRLLKLSAMNLEFRWVQDSIQADTTIKPEGCKVFLKGIPKGIPGLGVEVGSASENDVSYEVTRYQLFVGGDELWLIDKLAGILRVLGKDYYKDINSLL